MNVGFYYMANACGRLIGTVLSGAALPVAGPRGLPLGLGRLRARRGRRLADAAVGAVGRHPRRCERAVTPAGRGSVSRGPKWEGSPMSANLAGILTDSAARDADRIAIKLDDASSPTALLDDGSARVAGLLRERGRRSRATASGSCCRTSRTSRSSTTASCALGGGRRADERAAQGARGRVLPRGPGGEARCSPGTASPRPPSAGARGGRRRVHASSRRASSSSSLGGRRAARARSPIATRRTPR